MALLPHESSLLKRVQECKRKVVGITSIAQFAITGDLQRFSRNCAQKKPPIISIGGRSHPETTLNPFGRTTTATNSL